MSSTELATTYIPPEERPENIDPLTGLPNRAALNERLPRLLEHSVGRFALLFVDLDGLKEINDGPDKHEGGDNYLKGYVNAIQKSIRVDESVDEHEDEERRSLPSEHPDLLFRGKNYRTGGDEFPIILSGVQTDEEVQEIIGRLQVNLESQGARVSIGGRMSRPGDTAAKLLSDADEQMYNDKRQRRLQRYMNRLKEVGFLKRRMHIASVWLDNHSGNIKRPDAH